MNSTPTPEDLTKKVIAEAHIPNYVFPTIEDDAYILITLAIRVLKSNVYDLVLFNSYCDECEKDLIKKGVKMLEGNKSMDSFIDDLVKAAEKQVGKKFDIDELTRNQIRMRFDTSVRKHTNSDKLAVNTDKKLTNKGTVKEAVGKSIDPVGQRYVSYVVDLGRDHGVTRDEAYPKEILISEIEHLINQQDVLSLWKFPNGCIMVEMDEWSMVYAKGEMDDSALLHYAEKPVECGGKEVSIQDLVREFSEVTETTELTEDHLHTREDKIAFILRNEEWIPEDSDAFEQAFDDQGNLPVYLNSYDDESVDALYHTIERLMDEQGVNHQEEGLVIEDDNNYTESRIDPRFLALSETNRLFVLRVIGQLRLSFDGAVTKENIDAVVAAMKKHYDHQEPSKKIKINQILVALDPSGQKPYKYDRTQPLLNSESVEVRISSRFAKRAGDIFGENFKGKQVSKDTFKLEGKAEAKYFVEELVKDGIPTEEIITDQSIK